MKFIEDDRGDLHPVGHIQSSRTHYTDRHPEGAVHCKTEQGSFTTSLSKLEVVDGTIIPAEPGYTVWHYDLYASSPANDENALYQTGTVIAWSIQPFGPPRPITDESGIEIYSLNRLIVRKPDGSFYKFDDCGFDDEVELRRHIIKLREAAQAERAEREKAPPAAEAAE